MTETANCRTCGAAIPAPAQFCPACGASQSMALAQTGDLPSRFGAGVFDLLLWTLSSVTLLWSGVGWWTPILAWIVFVEIGYHLQGSIGKALFGLSVQVSGRARHYLREVIGKLASFSTFGIGFLLIMSKERRALHDYIAKTRVVRVRSQPASARAVATLGLFVGVGLAAYVGVRLGRSNPTSPSPSLPPQAVSNSLDMVTRQIPGVITLYLYDRQGNLKGQGSGFILTSEGLAATNFHVLEKAYRAEAKLGDGRLFHVLLVQAYDSAEDLITFRLGRAVGGSVEWPTDLPKLTLGSSTPIQIGDRIATVSSPEGLSNTISDGLVSGLRQAGSRRFLQITAPISPGSSGGPVFDLQGKVIGIVSFQLREAQNLNFAIPIENLTALLQRRDNLTLSEFHRQVQPAKLYSAAEELASLFERGRKLYDAERYLEALKVFLRAQSLRPEEAVSYYNAGLCYEQIGDGDGAATQYYLYLLLAGPDDPDRKYVINWMKRRGYGVPDH